MAAFRLFLSALRRQLACRHRVVTVLALVSTLLVIGAARADAQEVIEYYGTDALGSIRVVFAPNGTVKARSDYLPFGEEWQPATPGGPLPTQRFTGQQRDSEENLDYFNARSYQARTGRLTTVDPIFAGLFNPQEWNRYAYALNNPLAYVDPTGLMAESCQSAVGRIIVDGVLYDVADGTCVSGGGGGGGGGGGSALWMAWSWFRSAVDPVAEAPEVGYYHGGAGRPGPDPSLPGPGTEPNGNATNMTPAIIEGVTTVVTAVSSGGTGPVVLTIAKNVAKNVTKEAAKKAKGLFGQGQSSANPAKGTTTPRDLREQLAIEQVRSAPGGNQIPITMTDPRWPASDGWVKMQQHVNGGGDRINIHYLQNTRTGETADFKIVMPGPRPRP